MYEGYEHFTFGDLLRGFRQRYGVSRQALCERFGYHPNTIAAWENSDYTPKWRDDVLALEGELLLTQFEVDLLLFKASFPLEYGGDKGDAFGYLLLQRSEMDALVYPLRGGRPQIGRDGDSCEIVIPEAYLRVSRRHAVIYAEKNVVYVEDMGSRNGTFVDGERVTNSTPIEDGQHILLGGRVAAQNVCVLEYAVDLSSTL